MKKRLFGILLSFALMLGLVPGMGLSAYAAAVQSGGGFNSATVVVLGKNVKKISKGSFKNFRNVKTLVVQSKKLKKSSVKKSLKGSAVTKVKVQVGNKKTNKEFHPTQIQSMTTV